MTPAQQWRVVEAVQQRRNRATAGRIDNQGSSPTDSNRRTTVDVTERIKQHLSSAPAVLFMKGTPDFPQCGFSAQTSAALKACGATFHHVNIFEDPELREALKQYSSWPTFPQLYLKGELVGGCDIALEMYKNGELKQLLEQAGAV